MSIRDPRIFGISPGERQAIGTAISHRRLAVIERNPSGGGDGSSGAGAIHSGDAAGGILGGTYPSPDSNTAASPTWAGLTIGTSTPLIVTTTGQLQLGGTDAVIKRAGTDQVGVVGSDNAYLRIQSGVNNRDKLLYFYEPTGAANGLKGFVGHKNNFGTGVGALWLYTQIPNEQVSIVGAGFDSIGSNFNRMPITATASNIFTIPSNHDMVAGQKVGFEGIGANAAPTGAGESGYNPATGLFTNYYYAVNVTATTFQIANTPGGTPLAVSGGVGSVMHTFPGGNFFRLLATPTTYWRAHNGERFTLGAGGVTVRWNDYRNAWTSNESAQGQGSGSYHSIISSGPTVYQGKGSFHSYYASCTIPEPLSVVTVDVAGSGIVNAGGNAKVVATTVHFTGYQVAAPGVDAYATTIPLNASVTGIPSTGIIKITTGGVAEYIHYESASGTSLFNCTRGVESIGTTAGTAVKTAPAAHAAGDPVGFTANVRYGDGVKMGSMGTVGTPNISFGYFYAQPVDDTSFLLLQQDVSATPVVFSGTHTVAGTYQPLSYNEYVAFQTFIQTSNDGSLFETIEYNMQFDGVGKQTGGLVGPTINRKYFEYNNTVACGKEGGPGSTLGKYGRAGVSGWWINPSTDKTDLADGYLMGTGLWLSWSNIYTGYKRFFVIRSPYDEDLFTITRSATLVTPNNIKTVAIGMGVAATVDHTTNSTGLPATLVISPASATPAGLATGIQLGMTGPVYIFRTATDTMVIGPKVRIGDSSGTFGGTLDVPAAGVLHTDGSLGVGSTAAAGTGGVGVYLYQGGGVDIVRSPANGSILRGYTTTGLPQADYVLWGDGSMWWTDETTTERNLLYRDVTSGRMVFSSISYPGLDVIGTGAKMRIGSSTPSTNAEGVELGLGANPANVFRMATNSINGVTTSTLGTDSSVVPKGGLLNYQGTIPATGYLSPGWIVVGNAPTTIPTAQKVYTVAVEVPRTWTFNGVGVTIGAAATAEKIIVALHDKDGVVLRTSALAGTNASTTLSVYQEVPFTSAYTAKGPGRYYVSITFDSRATVSFRSFDQTGVAAQGIRVLGGDSGATYAWAGGTYPNFTPPTTMNADAPRVYLY